MTDVKFPDQADDNDAICPYCGDRYQVESEDYDEDERQEECSNCGKKYWLHQSFYVTNNTRADCELNGEDHKYELSESGKSRFCTICDDCELV